MSAAGTQAGNSGRGSAFALGGLLTLVLGCCVAGGLAAVLRERGAAGDAAATGSASAAGREEPASIDGPFHYAAVRRTREARPARFDATLPVGAGALVADWTDAHPPQGHVRDRVCAGDRAMADRWLTAIARAPVEMSFAANRSYVQLFEECVSPGLCRWAEEALRSARPAAVLRPVWSLASDCDDPGIDALFRDGDPPPEAYVLWADDGITWSSERGTLPTRVDVAKLAAAVEALVAEEPPREAATFTRGLPMLLGAADDPRAAAALLRMHAAAPDDETRRMVARAMHAQRERAARAVFDAYCAAQATADAICAGAASLPQAPLEVPAVVPVAPAIFSRLRALGLLGTPKPGGGVAQSAIHLLTQSGRAVRFERGGDEHDRTARLLAALATPVLDDAVFFEHEPFGEGDGDGDERNLLIAWSGGERFETALDPALEWENLEAVVGLLNVLARAHASSVRFVLNDSSGTAEVVAGLERSLRAAIAEGLIHVWLATPANADAPGDAILRALRGEEAE